MSAVWYLWYQIIKLPRGANLLHAASAAPQRLSVFRATTSPWCENETRSIPEHPVPPKPLRVFQLYLTKLFGI